jgi:hypothetical protein
LIVAGDIFNTHRAGISAPVPPLMVMYGHVASVVTVIPRRPERRQQ